jgi:hypothetical protein|tara:strand:- start:70 stop:639 length:570 start_codon:yes stop_codon:yes gene_type:complete
MSLKNQIKRAMFNEGIEDRMQDIASLIDMPVEDVDKRLKTLSFSDYVEVMTSLRHKNEDTIKRIMGLEVDEAYSTGTQGTQGTIAPDEEEEEATGTVNMPTTSQDNQKIKTARTQAMQRLGRDNLGGATAQQTADAMDKAGQGKALTPIQRRSMAAQTQNLDNLATNPQTRMQFKNLLNKLRTQQNNED